MHPRIPASFSGRIIGWSVAALDMDGDGLDDIVVGAPLSNNGASCLVMGSVFYYGSGTNNVGLRPAFTKARPPRRRSPILSTEAPRAA